MQHAIANGAHYYSLAYSPTNKKMDGHYRRIEVKLSNSKYKLAYRRGYNADSLLMAGVKADSDPLRSLMARGMPASSQLLYAVRVVPVSPQPDPSAVRAGKNAKLAGPVTRYGVDFMIRWTDVHLDATPDGKHSGKIRVELIAYDRDGKPVNWIGVTQAMDLKPDIYSSIQKSGIPAHLEIDLPSNDEMHLVSGVYDWATGKVGTLEVALQPATDSAKDSAPVTP
jgi:hypothetical protein